MGSFSAAATLQLPVQLHGIKLGRPVDMLLDPEQRHVVGYVVRCGDESQRFLPLGACETSTHEIAVRSALLLLEDVAFYTDRSVSFRSLLDGDVAGGELRDVEFDSAGGVETLEVERNGVHERIPAAGALVVPTRQAA